MSYLDDEVARVEDNPLSSPRDVQAAHSYRATTEGRWKAKVQEQVRQGEARAKERRNALYGEVRDVQSSADDDKTAADSGDIDYTELLNRRRRHLNRLGEIERKFEALENGEALLTSMREDPVEWMSNFYQKWQAFADRRPNVDDWLVEDRQKRNRR